VTPERWARLKEVFEAARHLEPSQQAAYLDDACAGDEEMRREAESLLRSLGAAESFIEEPALPTTHEVDRLVGHRLGPWLIVGEIARGGMGVVYRALRDDDEFEQEAAVKVLSAGVDTAQVAARFRAERSILARLEHPNIARLLDGGTAPDGRPYLVMEKVEGEWIDRYCDAHGLGVRERLGLFALVCDAVQYAHQNLVVHRDIKPGNILVTAAGAPRLLDFGIAKLLTPEHLTGDPDTVTALPALTPRYASPEQVTGGPITTASDVYSLGVLLYELLTGRPPYEVRTRSAEELARVVCRDEPERPSLAARRDNPDAATMERLGPAALPSPVPPRALAGDLDWIVLRALRKEPERRYASAREFAEDIRRHLAGQPVLARPDTIGYRAGKFARRHRGAVAAAALLVLSLAGGLFASVWQWRRAEAAHVEAERRFNDVRQLAGSLLFEVHDAIETLPGSTKARALIVERGVQYLDRLAGSSLDPAVRAELAAGYLRLGDVQGRGGEPSLGNAAAATQSYRKALRIAEALVGPGRAGIEHRALLARACSRLSENLRESGARKEASALLARSLSLLEAALADEPGNTRLQDRLAALRFEQAAERTDAGDWAGALDAYGHAAALYETLARVEPAVKRHPRNLALCHKYMGGVSTQLGRAADSRGHYEQALAIDREIHRASPDDPSLRLDLSYDLAEIAREDAGAGRSDAALSGLREALVLRRSVLAADPANAQARAAVARARGDLASVLATRGSRAEAEAEIRGSLGEWEALAAKAGDRVAPPLELVRALTQLAGLLAPPEGPASAAGRREACALYARGERIFSGLGDRVPAHDRRLAGTLAAGTARCRAR
jgi:non-specific serine/threonine protein kinase/serine/threonine-protein kinase